MRSFYIGRTLDDKLSKQENHDTNFVKYLSITTFTQYFVLRVYFIKSYLIKFGEAYYYLIISGFKKGVKVPKKTL